MKNDVMSTVVTVLFAASIIFSMLWPLRAASPPVSDEEIKSILRERVAAAGPGITVVAGVIDSAGRRVISEGPGDGDTVFEIGSVTKVFTALVFADMMERGEVKLEDAISSFLPQTVKVPSRNGRQITLLDLATHTSGLPRLPDNFAPRDGSNPYADYTTEKLYEFLSSYELPRDVGVKYEYSNLGGALLGHVLVLKAGTNYEALVARRICQPLGMTNTRITLPAEGKARLAAGHDASGGSAANWDFGALPGAGGLRSTANDLLKFLAANMGLVKTPLATAMNLAQQPRRDTDLSATRVGLAWCISRRHGAELNWHNGQTGGYHSFVGFNRDNSRGVVVLANVAESVDDIGFHLLDAQNELAGPGPRSKHTAIRLAPEILDRYAGRYELAPGVFFNLRRDNGRLLAQLTGQSYLEIFPESETEFFYKAVDAQITFVKNDQGEPVALILHQNGMEQRAEKSK